jgi:putative transposase
VIDSLIGQGINIRHACRVLGVSESGYYASKGRPDPPRTLRRIWLAGEIADVHKASGGTYGYMRVTAELRHGREILVGHNTVGKIMGELGIKGLPTRRLPKGARMAQVTSLDLVRREFGRDGPNQLWMTDITEHPTREGKVYCCVVLDAFSRLIVGWSIESTQTTVLVTNALGMATARRDRAEGLVIHSDRGSNLRPGPSVARSATPASLPRWVPSAAHTTMRWSSRSGGGCRSSSSTANAGRPGSSSQPRSMTTSSSSTTPGAVTRRSGCSAPPNTRIYTTQPGPPDSRIPTPFFRG